MRRFLNLFEDHTKQYPALALLEDHLGLTERPITQSPAFQQWFAGSKAVDADGKPLVLYHGTSKDSDFKSFKIPKNGVWFTTDPTGASDYARDNDSQGSKYDYKTNRYQAQHTAGRVLPVYLKITNPKRLETLPDELRTAQNYRKAQAIYFDKLRAEGYDSLIIDDSTYVFIDQNGISKIKSATGNSTFSDNKKNIHEALAVDSPAFRNWFGGSKVIDASGNPLPCYHGTGRPDRVGAQFRKSRATAGPMAYFTDVPKVASGYSVMKSDTSINDDEHDYDFWFKVKIPGSRTEYPVGRAWYMLSSDEKARLAELAPRVTTTDDGEEIILGEPDVTTGNGGYKHSLQDARGNVLAALLDCWVKSGHLFGEEVKFLTVLRLAGMTTPVRLDDPSASYPFVYQVFLSIKNPLLSTAVTPNTIAALEKACARQPNKRDTSNYQWDKKYTDAKTWLRDLIQDIGQTGGIHSWTVIPDWVTTTLKGLGYDGIQDVGGKNGGPGHTVWIPFEENQVKSAISNKNFNPAKKNIHESRLNEIGMTVYGRDKAKDKSPALSAVDTIQQAFEAHPILKKYVDVILTVKNSKVVELSFVETEKKKRSGHASSLFDLICKTADEFGVTLVLHAKPYTSRNHLPQDDLEAFYIRRGFVIDNEEAKDRWMTRIPGSSMSRRKQIDEAYQEPAYQKAWYDTKSRKMILVANGWHHCEWVREHPEEFDFAKTMGCSIDEYNEEYQQQGEEPPDYDDEIINNFFMAGWVRLGFEEEATAKGTKAAIYAEGWDDKQARQAIIAFRKYLDEKFPRANDGVSIAIQTLHGANHNRVLTDDDAEFFLKYGRVRELASAFFEDAPSVAEIPDEPNSSLARCTTVSCNAILEHFKKPLIKSAAEMPKTAQESFALLVKRGLKYIPDIFFRTQTLTNFVRSHPNGCWYLALQNHAISVVNGKVYDAERKGLDGRLILAVAEIVMP